MDANTLTIIAITVPMVIGFIGVIYSVTSSSSATNHRIDDFRADVDRRFTEQNNDMDRRFDEMGKQIAEVKSDLKEQKTEMGILSNRLNTYIDSFAVRIMTDSGSRIMKKSAARKA
jgi:hypothetical protein